MTKKEAAKRAKREKWYLSHFKFKAGSKMKLFSKERIIAAWEKYEQAGFDMVWCQFGSIWFAGYFCQGEESVYKRKRGELYFDGIVTYRPTHGLSWAERSEKKSPRADNPIEAIEKAYELWKKWRAASSDVEIYKAYKLNRGTYLW